MNPLKICFQGFIHFVVQPRFELGLTGPESVVLPLHHWTLASFAVTKVYLFLFFSKLVVQPRFELGQTGPESVVLPLHH